MIACVYVHCVSHGCCVISVLPRGEPPGSRSEPFGLWARARPRTCRSPLWSPNNNNNSVGAEGTVNSTPAWVEQGQVSSELEEREADVTRWGFAYGPLRRKSPKHTRGSWPITPPPSLPRSLAKAAQAVCASDRPQPAPEVPRLDAESWRAGCVRRAVGGHGRFPPAAEAARRLGAEVREGQDLARPE